MTLSQDGEPLKRLIRKRFVAIILIVNFFTPHTAHAVTESKTDRLEFRRGVIELPHIVHKPEPKVDEKTKPVLKEKPVKDFKPNKPSTKNVATKGYDVCSCVSYAKYRTGYKEIIGVARNWRVNSTEPVVGGVVVENIAKYGHVSIIIEVTKNGVFVEEANYIRCKKTSGRFIPFTSKSLIGFWKNE